MSYSQTRQKYEWITGGCKDILESPNIKKFYYSQDCTKISYYVELDVKEEHMRVCKKGAVYTPHFACGAAYVQNLGVGIYNIKIQLPLGKHINPEIRLVNMFGENRTAFQVLKGYTDNHNGYKSFMKQRCRVFSYLRNNTNISNIYIHKRRDWIDDINYGFANIQLIVTQDCVIMKLDNKVIIAASKLEASDAINDLNTIASLALVFAINIDSAYKDGDLKRKFKILSFDFMPLHEIDDAIEE